MNVKARSGAMPTIALLAALVAAGPIRAGSIWDRAGRRARMMYTDDTARDVGDNLTVVINERSVIENESSRSMNKKSSRDAKMDGTLDLANVVGTVGHHIFDFPKLGFSSSAETKFDGAADYDSDRSLTDKITVTVEDVLPNGNLVVLGTRQRATAGDVQVVQVSGIVRPSDIAFDNTVNSERVAEFRVTYKQLGRENRFTKPGWVARILNFLNPF